MNRRIQQSLLEKNSPAVKQADLLGKIYEVVNSGMDQRKKEAEVQVRAVHDVAEATRKISPGLA